MIYRDISLFLIIFAKDIFYKNDTGRIEICSSVRFSHHRVPAGSGKRGGAGAVCATGQAHGGHGWDGLILRPATRFLSSVAFSGIIKLPI